MSKTTVMGVDFLVYVGSSANPIAGQSDATLTRTIETADITSKDSAGWGEVAGVKRTWSITFDSLLISDDAGLAALDTAYANMAAVDVEMKTSDGPEYSGSAVLTNLAISAPHGGPATASGTLTGTGALTAGGA